MKLNEKWLCVRLKMPPIIKTFVSSNGEQYWIIGERSTLLFGPNIFELRVLIKNNTHNL